MLIVTLVKIQLLPTIQYYILELKSMTTVTLVKNVSFNRVLLLAAMVLGSSAVVSADSGSQRLQAFAGDRGGHSPVVARGSIRYQDPFFSLSYRYNDFGWDRYPRSRHQGWRFGGHRHSPKYAYGRHSKRHFDDHRSHRRDRYSDLIRHQRVEPRHFGHRSSDRRHFDYRRSHKRH